MLRTGCSSDRRLIRHAKLDPPTFGNLSVDLHLGAVSEAFRDRMKTFCADDANVKMLEQMNVKSDLSAMVRAVQNLRLNLVTARNKAVR